MRFSPLICILIRGYPLHTNDEASFADYWGYEILLPDSQIAVLSTAHSISTTLLNFFGAFVAASGAPELSPFLGYLSTYIDMEFKAIKAQNRGKGVVLAATCA